MTLGEIIHQQRKALDFSLEDVGKYCNVPRSTVSRWERGEIQKIKRDKIESLCQILQLDPTIFFRPAEILEPEEYDLLDAYRKADEGIRSSIRILLGIKKEART